MKILKNKNFNINLNYQLLNNLDFSNIVKEQYLNGVSLILKSISKDFELFFVTEDFRADIFIEGKILVLNLYKFYPIFNIQHSIEIIFKFDDIEKIKTINEADKLVSDTISELLNNKELFENPTIPIDFMRRTNKKIDFLSEVFDDDLFFSIIKKVEINYNEKSSDYNVINFDFFKFSYYYSDDIKFNIKTKFFNIEFNKSSIIFIFNEKNKYRTISFHENDDINKVREILLMIIELSQGNKYQNMNQFLKINKMLTY